MCNYGFPQKVQPNAMVDAVRRGLEELPELPRTLWVSAFNVFDDPEVPPSARRKIFAMLAIPGVRRIICESYADSITEEKVRECVKLLRPDQEFCIQIGIESTNEFVREICINKGLAWRNALDALAAIHAAGAKCFANLLIGAPFLNAHDSVIDAVSSVRTSLNAGFDFVTLFPNHVKKFTIVDWLFQRGQYRPVSLWAIIDILGQLNEQEKEAVYYSWLTKVSHPGDCDGLSPTGDATLGAELVRRLIDFQVTRDHSDLAAVSALSTSSRDEWLRRVATSSGTPDGEMEKAFPGLAEDIFGPEWWQINGDPIIADLQSAWRLHGWMH